MRAHHRNRFSARRDANTTRINSNPALLAAAILLSLGLAAHASAANFFVYKTADIGLGTLRQAAHDANARPGSHTIWFLLRPRSTITLTSGEVQFTGPNVTLRGPGRDWLTISGNHHSRMFDVQGHARLTVNDLTLRDGLALGDDSNKTDQRGGAILVGIPQADFTIPPPPETPGLVLSDVTIVASQAYSPTDGGGGAVFMQDGTLTIDHCKMDGNFARRNGGAVMTRRGSVQISDSQFTNNTTDFSSAEDENAAQGGGVFINRSSGSLTGSIIRGNRLTGPTDSSGIGQGAGFGTFLQNESFRIEDSEFSDNQSTDMPVSVGGGVFCHQEPDGSEPRPVLTLVNSTISGNTGNYGVGLEAGCAIALFNSTIANNTSTNAYGDGGRPGIEAYSPNTTEQSTVTIVSSVISGNLGGGADVGIYHNDGYADPLFVGSNALMQLVEADVTLPPDTIIGIDPQLAPLANNGGPTRTHALQSGSIAIDAGSNPQHLHFDQRGWGFPRVIGPSTDIGALESCPWSHAHCQDDDH